MYLVINPVVVDMFVGASVIIDCWLLGYIYDFLMINCTNPFSSLIIALSFFFLMASTINLGAISRKIAHNDGRTQRFVHLSIASSKRKPLEPLLLFFGLQMASFQQAVLIVVLQPLNFEPRRIFFVLYLSFLLFCLFNYGCFLLV